MWKFKKTVNTVFKNTNFVLKSLKRGKHNFDVSEEVRFALECGKPLVALESTIITHGMPFPENLKCALEVENIVRRQGAVPATIAVLRGKVTIGLNKTQISELADTKLTKSIKASRRDLPYIISQKLNGGTTVSGTIIIANKIGIPIFVTGGIGGVHREGENTFDISADLTELGRNSIAVVSSGVKSILDIPKTLEYLETQGVFVASVGSTTDFPAFYSRKSGFHAPYNVSTPLQAAEIIKSSLSLNINSGILFAVPIPEEYALDQDLIEKVIERALKDAERHGIKGKEVTPFLLEKVNELTGGKSLQANISLIRNNAETGAKIAVELSKLRQGVSQIPGGMQRSHTASPVILGGSVVDCCAKLKQTNISLDGSMHYTKFSISAGGVGRNICEALTKLGSQPVLISVVGSDNHGTYIRSLLPSNTGRHIKTIPNTSTAQCTVVLDSNGECKLLLGEMDIFQEITPELIMSLEQLLKRSPLLVTDGNLPVNTLSCVLEIADKYNIPVFYEPTDIPVAANPFKTPFSKALKFISPNIHELRTIANELNLKVPPRINDPITEAINLGRLISAYVDTIFITLGSLGLMIIRKADAKSPLLNSVTTDKLHARYYKTEEVTKLVNVSGAGDCLASGIIHAMLMGKSEANCVSVGFAAAKLALQSPSAVPHVLFDKEHISWKSEATYIEL